MQTNDGRIYDQLLNRKLAQLEKDFKSGLDDRSIMNRITELENEMRSDLLNDNVRLQRNDPRP